MPQRVLEKLEMRNPVLPDRDEFPVDHGVGLDSFQALATSM
jgi:hypothetical protein